METREDFDLSKCFLVAVLLEDCSSRDPVAVVTFDAETTIGNSVMARFSSTGQQQVRNPPTFVWVVNGRCSTCLQPSRDCKGLLIDPEI